MLPSGDIKVRYEDYLAKYIRKTGEYTPVLVDSVDLDVSDYLDKNKKEFINKLKKRSKIKEKFDSFGLRFDKYTNDFKPKEKKKIKKEDGKAFEELYKPDYKIVVTYRKFIKKYMTYRKSYRVIKLKQLRPEQYYNILRDLFRKAIGKSEGKVDIVTHNSKLDKPFHPKRMPTQEVYEDYLDVLADKIEYKELDITECTFDFHVIELPHGGKKTTKDDVVNKKVSVELEFPKTSGLTELAKGYFPHLFNTVENQNYIGKYPHEDYYGYQSMATKQRETFMKWSKFLIKGTIAIDEDIKQDVYSKKSIAWLDYLSNKHNINIQHALNGGEKKLRLGNKTYKVDGFYENTVYQFQGCHWHGCLRYNRESTINKQNQMCMKALYEKTQKINKKILDAGYELFQIWKCDFDNDKEIKKYIKKEWKREFVTPLNPRDAFYGGRCEPTTLKYEMKGEKGRYIDVCSLYPTVNFFDYYPIGHPDKIYNPKRFSKKWYGLIKCKILPPRKLYHPVLPYKEEKLIFSLCKSCSETIKCKHKNEAGKPKSAVEKKNVKNAMKLEIRNVVIQIKREAS
ncbi:DNA_pol_B_2 domain-containing protein [Trichonephila clavata]|uniref:DNA-directed DNA polymerase n=1 Tax=Trichonephila clavata TaxID=2740835 RepID=A0A8X6LPG1_TRICU|nr:DNA_pol_B_2 domain-containing protein [Trichonephila clavata]